ncbi:MAG TPA: STAS/SEC14 domain-containing protein [Thermoanaerobaculia bacterium]|jgi:hypothetical protein|nr:STAS/SEC14 domain-containing protein [Thermoanaerobaculia bacterium]
MVTRKVELTEEQNETLEQIAASQGRSVADLIRTGVDVLLKDVTRSGSGRARSLSQRESELLLGINRGLPGDQEERYRELMSRRRTGILAAEEHQELLRLTDEAERLQAERIERLAELARLRAKPLVALMEELGVRPSPNA